MEEAMVFFRKDGSLEPVLTGMFYPPISQVDKMCKIILNYGGQYHKKKDGGVKFYLLEETDVELEKQNGRLFLIPEKILEFDRSPKVFVEANEHIDFVNGKKAIVHIFTDRVGGPFVTFFVPHAPQKEDGHAFFSFKDGYEVLIFLENKEVKFQIVEIKSRMLSSGKYVLYEIPVFEGDIQDKVSGKLWKFDRALKAAKEKFFSAVCNRPYFFREYVARPK